MEALKVMTYSKVSLPTRNWDSAINKRWGLRVVLVESRQLSPKRFDVRRNHMAGIPLGIGKGL